MINDLPSPSPSSPARRREHPSRRIDPVARVHLPTKGVAQQIKGGGATSGPLCVETPLLCQLRQKRLCDNLPGRALSAILTPCWQSLPEPEGRASESSVVRGRSRVVLPGVARTARAPMRASTENWWNIF